MKEIIVKTQAELDALPARFEEFTTIFVHGGTSYDIIVVRVARENSSVVAWENSSVVARGNSSVEAWENSSVVAWENSSVVARGNSSVEAWENSSVVAWENSSVVAWENSSVVAWESSSVVARGNSSVVARENSSVEAWGNVGVRLQSDIASVTLHEFAVCWALFKTKLTKGKLVKKSKTATIIKSEVTTGTDGWLKSQAVKKEKGYVLLFKRVSIDFKTMESTPNETLWEIGKTLEHVAWAPASSECGEGKFHACSRPYFCDEFRSKYGDKYIAIKVAVKDMHAWDGGQYPHKVAFRKGTVLYQCNKFGKKIS